MKKMFLEGANAHKRLTETVVASSTGKSSESKMARLQGFCCLSATERVAMPPIWMKIQQATDKEEVKCVVQNNFNKYNKPAK